MNNESDHSYTLNCKTWTVKVTTHIHWTAKHEQWKWPLIYTELQNMNSESDHSYTLNCKTWAVKVTNHIHWTAKHEQWKWPIIYTELQNTNSESDHSYKLNRKTWTVKVTTHIHWTAKLDATEWPVSCSNLLIPKEISQEVGCVGQGDGLDSVSLHILLLPGVEYRSCNSCSMILLI